MNNRSTKVLNVLISCGIVFFVLVIVVAFLHEELLSTNWVYATLLLASILLGAFTINTAVLATKKAYQLFIGLLLAGWGILTYLIHLVFPYTMYQWWPVFLILAGIFLIASGFYKYHGPKAGFCIPAFTLIGMGLWYLLFSFKIIKVSFSLVACIIGPFFMAAIAIFLVLFFLAQQKHKDLLTLKDEEDTFSDEELD